MMNEENFMGRTISRMNFVNEFKIQECKGILKDRIGT
jgi:hypothetical protein